MKVKKENQNDAVLTQSDHKSLSKDVHTALQIEEENAGMESAELIKHMINIHGDSDGSR